MVPEDPEKKNVFTAIHSSVPALNVVTIHHVHAENVHRISEYAGLLVHMDDK